MIKNKLSSTKIAITDFYTNILVSELGAEYVIDRRKTKLIY